MTGRRLPRPQRSTLGVGALVVAGLSVSQALSTVVPSPTDGGAGEGSQRPFVREATVGQPTSLRTGELLVTDVEGATTVTAPFAQPATTQGVFVVLRFSWTPTHERSTVTTVTLTDARDRTYRVGLVGSGRDGVACLGPPPGVTALCTAAVEVPRDALPGATVRLETNGFDPGWDDVAELALPVDDASAATLGSGRTAAVDSTYRGLT
ncbi:hypothetical protein DFJ68_1877 [Terracoccus luteus]|uniref:Uncharacterized protein n=1 Tax=Terracoccus luteus TaxID=53356 RepID=A0A495XV36_9MICO|nr:hypothetical protein [Terracoccus luteus]RKT78431.1 hypothetical protein DFJ68_1877 [Terracoccus luteus]